MMTGKVSRMRSKAARMFHADGTVTSSAATSFENGLQTVS